MSERTRREGSPCPAIKGGGPWADRKTDKASGQRRAGQRLRGRSLQRPPRPVLGKVQPKLPARKHQNQLPADKPLSTCTYFLSKKYKLSYFFKAQWSVFGREPHTRAHSSRSFISSGAHVCSGPRAPSSPLLALTMDGVGRSASWLLCDLSPWGLGHPCFLHAIPRDSRRAPLAGWGQGGRSMPEQPNHQHSPRPVCGFEVGLAAGSAGQPRWPVIRHIRSWQRLLITAKRAGRLARAPDNLPGPPGRGEPPSASASTSP